MKIIDHIKSASIFPWEGDVFHEISVLKDKEDPEIAWGAPGPVSPEKARLFGEALIKAAEIAEMGRKG
jgi:hypothetical protein